MSLRSVPKIPDDTPAERCFTVEEVAKILSSSPKSVRAMITSGAIGYLDLTPDDGRERERRTYRIPLSCLRQYIEANTIPARVGA